MTVARCYARLSKSECALNCPECSHRYIPTDPLASQYTCPQCGAKAPHSLVPLSIQAQKHTLTEVAKRLDVTDALLYPDVISAGVDFDKRPQGARLLKDLQKGDHLIVVKLDRGWRSMLNFRTTLDLCLRMDVSLHILDLPVDLSTAIGKLIAQILAAFAEMEREQISERTKAGKAQLRRNGKPQNGCEPIGMEFWCTACGCRLPRGGGRHNQCVTDCPCGAVRRENIEVRVSTIDHAVMRLMFDWNSPRHFRNLYQIMQQLRDDGIRNPKTGYEYNYRTVQMWIKRARELEADGNLLPLPQSELEVRNWLPTVIGQRTNAPKRPATRPAVQE